MNDLIKHLNDPEVYFPGNFDTVKRANAMLSCLCQEAADALEAKDAEIAKYKALCDQLGTALDGHCAPLPGYEQEHIDALTAWREMK